MPLIRPGVKQFFRLSASQSNRADVDAEIALHLELRAQQLQRLGLSPEAARAEAARRFGNTDAAQHELLAAARQRDRTMGLTEQLSSMIQDARYAARGLVRERWFTVFVAITLGLGIGVNAAMYGVVDRLLLNGPEYVQNAQQVQRLYASEEVPGRSFTSSSFGYVTYSLMRQNAKHMRVAAYRIQPEQLTFGTGLDAERWTNGEATADLFPLLGVTPQLGRFFTPDEDQPSGPQHVAVLGYGVWKRLFNADSGIVGKTVSLSNEPYTVIGVARPAFTGPELARVDVWIPISLRSRTVTKEWTTSWNAQWLRVVARLAPGSSTAQASAEATAIFRNGYGGNDPAAHKAVLSLRPLSFNERGAEAPELAVARWLIGVCIIVLIVACSNVGNLLLARVVRRQREVAVRLALGVSRARLLRLFFIESLMLAAVGAVAGIFVAYVTGAFMRVVLLPTVEWASSPVSGNVLIASMLIALVVAMVIGLLPAWRASRPDINSALRAGVREGGAQKSRARTALTVAQSALSVVLLVGAGLFVQSLMRVRALDLGIQPDRVVVVALRWLQLPSTATQAERNDENARRRTRYLALLERLRHEPGVERASISVGLPFQSSFSVNLRIPGRDSLLGSDNPNVSAVTDGYFETTGGRIIRGRAFTSTDRAGSEPVTIVSETMAKHYWPGTDPIGNCIYTGDDATAPCARIVGVSNDARKFRLTEEPSTHYYIPFGQEVGIGGTSLLVRPAGKPGALYPAIRKAVQEIDPTASFVDIKLLQDVVDPQIRPWRLGASVFALMGILALFVAAVGLYSVMSYLVAQRRHELGVRMALGATSRDILTLIMRSGMLTAASGVLLGTIVALLGGRYIEPLLFQTSPRDVSVFSVVVVALLSVAAVSTIIPALRARRVSPIDALRAE